MSNPWLPRAPTFPGLRPDPPVFVPVDDATAQWLQSESGLTGQVSRLQSSVVLPLGHFRLLGPDQDVFLKVLSVDQAAHNDEADKLAQSAKEAGAPVLPPLRWIETRRGPVIGVYPHINARYGEPTVADASKFGAALVRLHRALKNCSEAPQVRRASLQRMRMLATRRTNILAGEGPLGPNPATLQNLLANAEAPFEPDETAQIVHGDLNLGNVLFDEKTGEPTIIDFENATVSWLPPEIDIAMALQRLCLTAVVSDESKAQCASAFLVAYHDEGYTGRHFSAAALVEAMRWISIRNLCLLAEAEASGREVNKEEWQKFLSLVETAEDHKPLLDAALAVNVA
jgi:hypothetical protein